MTKGGERAGSWLWYRSDETVQVAVTQACILPSIQELLKS
ncbi:hypothetical protein SOVF_182370 [Spinacia oleracea]|nr:hypothetical protein SOVF_182370 [Spinacia oleracea]